MGTVLMVEGSDDQHVVKHICGTRGLGAIDLIHPYQGAPALLEGIGPRLKQSDLQCLGIMLDADESLAARWQAVASRLRAAGYAATPDFPDPNGTVLDSPDMQQLPRVGVWLMPDNQVEGILENFLQFLVPTGDPLFGHIEASVAAIGPEVCRFSELYRPKAKIHTWLAWQDDPGRPFGQAISKRYLDPTLPAANLFAGWLQRTFFVP